MSKYIQKHLLILVSTKLIQITVFKRFTFKLALSQLREELQMELMRQLFTSPEGILSFAVIFLVIAMAGYFIRLFFKKTHTE